RRHFFDGWGRWRIAKELNAQGVPASAGSPWYTDTVALILRNPVYTGRGIANRYSDAVYHMRAPSSPVKSEVDPKLLATRKSLPLRTRPRRDWIEQEYPQLKDYLGDEHLRALAIEDQSRRLEAQGVGHTPAFSRDRHQD